MGNNKRGSMQAVLCNFYNSWYYQPCLHTQFGITVQRYSAVAERERDCCYCAFELRGMKINDMKISSTLLQVIFAFILHSHPRMPTFAYIYNVPMAY